MLVDQITQHLDQTTSTYYATSFAQKLNRTCLFHFFVTYRCVHHIMEVMSIFQASFKRNYTVMFRIICFRFINSARGCSIWCFKNCSLCYCSNQLFYSLWRRQSGSICGYLEFGWPFLLSEVTIDAYDFFGESSWATELEDSVFAGYWSSLKWDTISTTIYRSSPTRLPSSKESLVVSSTCWTSSACEPTWLIYWRINDMSRFWIQHEDSKIFFRENRNNYTYWFRKENQLGWGVGTSNYTSSIGLIICETVSISFSYT